MKDYRADLLDRDSSNTGMLQEVGMGVGAIFGDVDGRDRKRIVQGQAQGPSPINVHQVLPIAGATLAEFYEVFDCRIMQAGDGLDHGP